MVKPDTPEKLGESFVDMIKHGQHTQEEREIIRDALLDGVLVHPIVRKIVAEADYSTRANNAPNPERQRQT